MSEKDPILVDIGERLEKVRRKLELTQREVAQAIGISDASYSGVEAGTTKPTFEVYYHLPLKYNVNPHYLINGIGPMFRDSEQQAVEMKVGEGSAEFRTFIVEFMDLFKKSPLVRTAMIQHYESYILENIHLVEKSLQNKPVQK